MKTESQNDLKRRLINALKNDLPVLRARVGLSQEVLADKIGISRQTYSSIETGKREMAWTTFLALVAFFQNNEQTLPIENSDQKALIIALLLLSILAYVNSNYVGEGDLKNVILLEEAHVLLDADTNAGQGDANPSAIAQGLVKRMLAEIRSYGVGLIIADQSPRKVTTDVVALTDIKVAFRLVEASDKQILAESIDMDDTQVSRLTKLKPGEAFFFFNKLEAPEEIVTPNYRLENNISITLSDEGIRSLSTYWSGRETLLRPYPECCVIPYCLHTCDYNRRVLAKEIARRIFVRHFKSDMKDFDAVRKVFGHITKLVISELNDEPFDKQLLACVKAQLWRRIKYGTKIPVTDQLIKTSLEKA